MLILKKSKCACFGHRSTCQYAFNFNGKPIDIKKTKQNKTKPKKKKTTKKKTTTKKKKKKKMHVCFNVRVCPYNVT